MSRRILPLIGGLAAVLAPSLAVAAEGSEAGGGSWLWLLVFTVNFAVFIGVLAYFAAPLARRFFAERAVAIRANFERLESALHKAQDYQGRAAARIEKLEEELRLLGEDLEAETALQVGKIRAAAREAAQRIGRDTELTIAAKAQEARTRVRARLAAAAAGPARELISRSIGPADQKRLIDSFMDRLSMEAQR